MKVKGDTTEGFTMHKVTVVLAAITVFLGCDVGRPTSPSAAKSIEASVEQCPMPILSIAGTWARSDWIYSSSVSVRFSSADTLRIELASDPNPTGEPGVTYYDYTQLSYYFPSAKDDPGVVETFGDLAQPFLWREQRGKIGVYYVDGGKWLFNYTVTYSRMWNAGTKEYAEEGPLPPSWGREIGMFDGWLVLGWDYNYGDAYKRVDDNPVDSEHEEEHAEAVGLIVRDSGTEIVRVESGQVTGEIEIGPGEETALLSVRFIDEDGYLFTPDENDDYALDWEIADESIAEVEHHAEDGAWGFRILGLAAGQTTIRIKINHEGHAYFVSPEIEIHSPEIEIHSPEIEIHVSGTGEITPEIIGLYGTLVSTVTNIFFAALVPGTTSVPGEGGGSVEIAGNNWTLQDYSPDGALIANGALNIDLTQDPIPMSGEVAFSGSHEAELILDMELSVGTDGLHVTGTITINGTKFDAAEVSAAAAAAG